ncbi:MAG: ROK family protein [Bacteroidota bacterium]
MEILGIDVGGSGMKGGIVNIEKGELISERFRIPTPKNRKPKDMAEVISEIVSHFNYKGKVGCGFPTVIKKGSCKSPGNLHPSWMNVNVEELFQKKTGLEFTVVNDADIAGYAAMEFGIGRGMDGLVIMITIGTGLGSGAFYDGKLIPNFELGQIPYKKYKKIEHFAAASVKEREGLSYKKWGKRFNKFLEIVDIVVAPDVILIGGGTSKYFDEFKDCITIETPVYPAKLKNHAGIIGAAAAALHKIPRH